MPESKSQTIEQLRQRYDDLNEQKIVFQTQKETAQKQLDQLKADALKLYGTDDLKSLQKKLAELKAENEEKRVAYQGSLDSIEEQLNEVQTDFAAAGEGAEE